MVNRPLLLGGFVRGGSLAIKGMADPLGRSSQDGRIRG